MKLIFIASANSIHSIRWIKYFINKKYKEIYLVSLTKPNHETLNEFNEIKNKIKVYFILDITYLFLIIKLLISNDKSIVHIHYLGWHSLLILFLKKTKKIILTPWGSDILKINKLKKLWLKYLIKKSSCIICDSNRLKIEAIKLGAKRNKVIINMFGVDTDLYKKKATIFSNKNIVIGSNRKFETVYDLKTFLFAAKELSYKSKKVKFLLAGDGSLKDDYIDFVKVNKLESQITFLGLLNKDEMINFYNSIDIFVSTSLSDGGLSSSIAEAMSFERIVVVTDNSDNKLWIKNKSNGMIFKNKKYKQLFRILENIINNKENYLNLPKLAREIIRKNYSYKNQMNKVNSIYKKILNNE